MYKQKAKNNPLLVVFNKKEGLLVYWQYVIYDFFRNFRITTGAERFR